VRFFTARLGSVAAAEDLVQDIYVKICALDPATQVQNEAAFLYRLGSNLMLDRLRQQRRAATRDGDWRGINVTLVGAEEVADEPSAEETIAGRQRLAQVVEALKSMPPQHREAFRLHRLEGMSQAQTAAALGVSVSSVEKYVRAALTHILAQLR
jgi:RNA polymerase sigma factor (sigma-70 family)